jgi:hypothetical protein
MLLSKLNASGSGHSSGYSGNICKVIFHVYNFFKKYVPEENEADWITVNART